MQDHLHHDLHRHPTTKTPSTATSVVTHYASICEISVTFSAFNKIRPSCLCLSFLVCISTASSMTKFINSSKPYKKYKQRQLGRILLKARSEEHTSELQSQSNLVCR